MNNPTKSKSNLDAKQNVNTIQTYKTLFDKFEDAFALCEIICDDNNNPIDYKFILTNPAFAKHTGLRSGTVLGKTVKQIYPDIEQSWIDRYGQVALTKKPINFTEYNQNTKRHYAVKSYSPVKNHFIMQFTDITREKSAINELKESEKKYRTLYDNAPLSYQSLDKDGCFLDINPAWLNTLGYVRQEVMGKCFADFLHSDWKMHFEKNFPAFIKRGYVSDVEFKIRHKEGYYLDISFEGCIGYHPDGSFKQTYCVFQDITERKKAEEELKKEKHFLEAVFDSISEGIVSCDANGILTRFNRATKEFHGLPKEAIAADEWSKHYDIYHPDGKTSMHKEVIPLYRALSEGTVQDAEMMIIPKNGKARSLVVNGKMLKDSKGDSIGAVVAMHDITERKKEEYKLLKSEHNLAQAERMGNTGSWDYEVATDTASWSENMFRIFDVDPEMPIELVFKHFIDNLVHTDDRQHVRDIFADALIGKRPYDLEYRVVKKDGSVIVIHAIAETLRDEHANAIRMIGKVEDITERKQAEDLLQRSEFRLKETQRITKLGGWEYDVASNQTYFSDEVFNIYGIEDKYMFAAEEGVKFYHPDDRSKVMDSFTKAITNAVPYDLEVRFINTRGENMWVRTAGKPILENGKVVKIIGNIMDITNRKLAQEELLRERNFSKNILDTAQAIILTLDTDGKIISINHYLEQITGYKMDEVIGKDWFNTFLPDKDHNKIRKLFNSALQGLPTKANINSIISKDGREIPIEWFDTTFKDETGNIIGLLSIGQDITVRKLAAEELQKSEKQFRILADHTFDWEYWKKPNGDYVYLSPSCERITGYTAKEYMADPNLLTKIVKPDYSEKIKNHLKHENNGDTPPITMELPIVTKGGEERWIEHRCSPIFDDNGEYIGRRGNNREITKRKLATLELTEEKNKASNYLNIAAVMLVSVDTAGIVNLINPKGCDILGYTQEEIIGKNWFDTFIPSENRKEIKSVAKNIYSGEIEAVEYYENVVLTKSGSEKLIGWNNAVLKDEDGKIVNVLSSGEDITERKQAEDALKISEDRLSKTLIAANDGMWDWDLITNIVYFDPRYYKMAGYAVDEFPYKFDEFQKRIHPDDVENVLGQAQLHLEGKQDRFRVEFRFKKKSGDWFWIMGRGQIVDRDKNNKPLRFIGTHTDITALKKIESELEKHRDHLEELVQERTLELSEANKELDSFSHSVSHDLRAPLRAIDGFTHMLIEDYATKLDKKGQRLGTVIQDNVKKMSKLIDDLLSFSRLGREAMSFSNIDMKNMVNSIYHEVTVVDERKRIKLNIADIPKVEGDTVMMRQVWINLISNAVKFSSKRKQAVITVSCSEEKDKLIYCIKDNGAGFNMKYADKLFGVFQRLHSEKDFEGTGVGLSLVQRIINRHNGTIWAKSKVDKGAEFYFSLPKKKIRIIE